MFELICYDRLERYARERPAFRTRVLEHKRDRQLAVGPHVTWLFEDRLTMQYQVQEMLRAERIFEPEGIAEELESYNPLIPDGSNWKVTLLIEYPDESERRRELTQLKGIEDRCWVQVSWPGTGFRDRRRGSGARERGEDLGGAFPAFRAHAGHDCGLARRVRSWPWASITPSYQQLIQPVRAAVRDLSVRRFLLK